MQKVSTVTVDLAKLDARIAAGALLLGSAGSRLGRIRALGRGAGRLDHVAVGFASELTRAGRVLPVDPDPAILDELASGSAWVSEVRAAPR